MLGVREVRGIKRINIDCTPTAITETSVNNKWTSSGYLGEWCWYGVFGRT